MANVLVRMPDSLFKHLKDNAFNSHATFNDYINAVLKTNLNYVPNLEEARYLGAIVSQSSIRANHNTIVLGGSNYTYQLQGADNVSEYTYYRVIDFRHGNIILKPIRK